MRCAQSVDHAGLEEHRAWYVLATRGFVVVAKALAAAANAVLVAQHLLKLGAHLTTALARLQVYNLARKSSLEVGSTREKKGAEEGKCKKLKSS